MGLLTRRRGTMLVYSLVMAVIFSMVSVMLMRWGLGRHMLASRAYKSGMNSIHSQAYAFGSFSASLWEDLTPSGATAIDGREISYVSTIVGISGTPATPFIPASPGTPEVPATPGSPAVPGTPEVPATPAQPEVEYQPSQCAGYAPDCSSYVGNDPPTDPGCGSRPGCVFVPGQAFRAERPEQTCYETCYDTCYDTCNDTCPGACTGDPPVCEPDYDCNPHDCNPHDCNPHNCNPWICVTYLPELPRIENQCNEIPEPEYHEITEAECTAGGGTFTPGVPYSPAIPGTPGSPAVPEIPAIPATPGIPATPAHGDIPATPGTPHTETNKVVFTSGDW